MGKPIDLTGHIIGKLTILERKRENNRTYYYCRCDCGNELWIRADSLKITKSCGCLKEETQFKAKDISNKNFNRLTALTPTEERDKNNGSVIWKCKCVCGNVCYVPAYELTQNKVQSCGCLGKENSQKNIQKALKKHLEEHIIEGTNIPVISRKKVILNNTSGVTGVIWDKSRNKWKAVIEFKKRIYYLGRYDKKEDAIKIRKEAEEKLFGKFLEWYYENFSNNK